MTDGSLGIKMLLDKEGLESDEATTPAFREYVPRVGHVCVGVGMRASMPRSHRVMAAQLNPLPYHPRTPPVIESRWVPGQTYVDEMEFAGCPDERIHGFKVRYWYWVSFHVCVDLAWVCRLPCSNALWLSLRCVYFFLKQSAYHDPYTHKSHETVTDHLLPL